MKKALILVTIFSFSMLLTACIPSEVSCDEGYELVNGTCEEVAPTCNEGFELVNGTCEEVEPTCDEGYELVNETCEEVAPTCDEGLSLVDGECVEDEIECELPETLVGDQCEVTHVLLPDLIGLQYGEVLTWSFDNDINLNQSSEYNDDVEPNSVFYQEFPAGSYVEIDSDLIIKYSRGFDPNGVITLPDFTGWNETEIKAWLAENDLKKWDFANSFDPTIEVGVYVSHEVTKIDNHDENLRRDNYVFYMSTGPLEIETVEFDEIGTVRGVNLGGWFVLEGWMTPNLFSGVDGSDETEFMIQKENSLEAIENHWNTFITEDDFIWLSQHNVDYVRIPIPWWYKGGLAYEGTEYEVVYGNSEAYIHKAMQWAERYDIKVLLDLHTAPWCQNGFDNGGMAGVFKWHTDPANIDLTIDVLEDIASDFSQYDSLWGIELLNEPAWAVPYNVLLDFYVRGYDAIRAINSDVWIGMHDGFRGYEWSRWASFFIDNNFQNVFFDMHLYQTFGDFWGDFDIHDHLEWVEVEQDKAIHRYDSIVPTIIGEWSLGLQGNVYEDLSLESIKDLKIAYGNKQLNKYEESMGWFFWNYKIDANSHMEWDFKRLVEHEIFPNDFQDDENAN